MEKDWYTGISQELRDQELKKEKRKRKNDPKDPNIVDEINILTPTIINGTSKYFKTVFPHYIDFHEMFNDLLCFYIPQ